jgi:hypothetical protein
MAPDEASMGLRGRTAAHRRDQGKRKGIEAATAQIERALRTRKLALTMPHGSYSLGETAAKLNMVRLKCLKCGRSGQYRVDELPAKYGPYIAIPDLRRELAQCPHRYDMSNPCQVDRPTRGSLIGAAR